MVAKQYRAKRRDQLTRGQVEFGGSHLPEQHASLFEHLRGRYDALKAANPELSLEEALRLLIGSTFQPGVTGGPGTHNIIDSVASLDVALRTDLDSVCVYLDLPPNFPGLPQQGGEPLFDLGLTSRPSQLFPGLIPHTWRHHWDAPSSNWANLYSVLVFAKRTYHAVGDTHNSNRAVEYWFQGCQGNVGRDGYGYFLQSDLEEMFTRFPGRIRAVQIYEEIPRPN